MRCINTYGSYKCICEDGFQQNGDQCLQAAAPGKVLLIVIFLKLSVKKIITKKTMIRHMRHKEMSR